MKILEQDSFCVSVRITTFMSGGGHRRQSSGLDWDHHDAKLKIRQCDLCQNGSTGFWRSHEISTVAIAIDVTKNVLHLVLFNPLICELPARDWGMGYNPGPSDSWLHSMLVFRTEIGLILSIFFQDELRLIPDPDKKETPKSPSKKSSPSKKGKKTSKNDPQQRTIHDMVHPTSSSQPPPSPDPGKAIQVIDTKTRSSNSVPTHADTLPSRLQLMLYRQLLVDILGADPVLFLDLFARLNCDPARPFSKKFKADMNLMVASNELHLRILDAGCLLDMLEPLQESMEGLVTRKVAQSLSLVYRMRNNNAQGYKARRPETPSKAMEFEDQDAGPSKSDLSVASTSGKSSPRKRKHDELCKTDADAAKQSVAPAGTQTPLLHTVSKSRLINSIITVHVASAHKGEAKDTKAQAHDKDLIGTKKFKFNGQILEQHMKAILMWWYGERPSEGVSMENTHRCR